MNEPITHHLRTWPAYFERVVRGEKTFEVRKDDRGYQTGDQVVLHEWDAVRCGAFHLSCKTPHDAKFTTCHGYTRRSATFRIGFIFKAGFGIDLGQHVVLSLLPAAESEPEDPRLVCEQSVEVGGGKGFICGRPMGHSGDHGHGDPTLATTRPARSPRSGAARAEKRIAPTERTDHR